MEVRKDWMAVSWESREGRLEEEEEREEREREEWRECRREQISGRVEGTKGTIGVG